MLELMVKQSGAVSTDMKHPEDVVQLTKKCVAAAEGWEPVADELWSHGHYCSNCKSNYYKGEM
jgi:hypothetical protein